jgi:hypothetical protein
MPIFFLSRASALLDNGRVAAGESVTLTISAPCNRN